jgi:hypothetical protein
MRRRRRNGARSTKLFRPTSYSPVPARLPKGSPSCQLTTKYTRMAMTQKLRRIIDEGVTLGLALEGISAADVARAK